MKWERNKNGCFREMIYGASTGRMGSGGLQKCLHLLVENGTMVDHGV